MKLSLLFAAALAFAMVPGRAAADADCPASDPSNTAGASASDQCGTNQQSPGTGGAGAQEGTTPSDQGAQTTTPPPQSETTVVVTEPQESKPPEKSKAEGLSVGLLGGVEGFSGSLAPNINPGGAWGVLVGAQPLPNFGIELAYNGSQNFITDPRAGPDAQLVMNGGNVDLKVSLLPKTVEPYLFGGIGVARMNALSVNADSGYRTDTFGQVPVGGGLNFHMGEAATVGARVGYNFLFNRDFTPSTRTNAFGLNNKPNGDMWDARLQLGATF